MWLASHADPSGIDDETDSSADFSEKDAEVCQVHLTREVCSTGFLVFFTPISSFTWVSMSFKSLGEKK